MPKHIGDQLLCDESSWVSLIVYGKTRKHHRMKQQYRLGDCACNMIIVMIMMIVTREMVAVLPQIDDKSDATEKHQQL